MGNPKFVWKARVIEWAEFRQIIMSSQHMFAGTACAKDSVSWAGGISKSIDRKSKLVGWGVMTNGYKVSF